MKIPEAAKALGVSESTLRYWIREKGAPVTSQGSSGRGRGAEVDLGAICRWRYVESNEVVLQAISLALLDIFIRDGASEDKPVPLWRTLELPKAGTAALILRIYERIYRRVTGLDIEEYPIELQGLLTVYLDYKDALKNRRSCRYGS